MKKINLAITGCMGRMGQQLIKSVKKNKTFNLVALTERTKINKKISGIKPEFNSTGAFKKASIIIITHSVKENNSKKCLKSFTSNKNIIKKPVLLRLF